MILKGLKPTLFTSALIALCAVFFSFAGVANALEISLEPANVEREVNGKVLVNIFANPADSLISMGVKVTFAPAVLTAIEVGTSKYENVLNGWLMDADGDPDTLGDQYANPAIKIDNTNGFVEMLGGHLVGTNTTGLTGKVLLGWILFEAVANGNSDLIVDLAKYHPDSNETFDNFVNLNGVVDEPSNLGVLGSIVVKEGACESNLTEDGNVNFADLAELKQNFFIDCSTLPPGEMCLGDLNGDGSINFEDLAMMKADFFRSDCPSPLPVP